MTALLIYVLIRGAWTVSFPVEGLSDENREELVALFQKNLREDSGEEATLKVATQDDIVYIRFDCPKEHIRLSEIEKALNQSRFSLSPKGWLVQGHITVSWAPKNNHDEEAIRKRLEKLAKCTLTSIKKESRARLEIASKASLKVKDLSEALKELGIEKFDLMWERDLARSSDRCGARRP